jgi:tryptophanyl-tRNA synthetase
VIVLIANYQVMTDQQPGAQLAATVRGVVADYLAAGIDPQRTTIFTPPRRYSRRPETGQGVWMPR